MPVQMGWLVENRLLVLRFEGIISDEDMDTIDNYVVQCYDTSPLSVVHLIADTRAITVQNTLKKTLRMKCVRHDRRGWTMTIGTFRSAALRFLVRSITVMFQIRHRDVDALEEALEFLQRVDPALPGMSRSHMPVNEPGAGTYPA